MRGSGRQSTESGRSKDEADADHNVANGPSKWRLQPIPVHRPCAIPMTRLQDHRSLRLFAGGGAGGRCRTLPHALFGNHSALTPAKALQNLSAVNNEVVAQRKIQRKMGSSSLVQRPNRAANAPLVRP